MARTPVKHLQRGQKAEDRARRFLAQSGLRLVERNYRSPQGEIDLIMNEGATLVFIEVRYRSNENFGLAGETVDLHKQRKLRACAEHYLMHNVQWNDRPCRFDVVTIVGNPANGKLNWYTDAFQ